MSRQLESLGAFMGARPPSGERGLPHVVVLAAGKGGAGVSTMSALLAAAAAACGSATLLVDAAPCAGSLGELLGAEEGGDESLRFIMPNLTFASLSTFGGRASGERRARLRRIAGRYDDYEFVVIDAGASAEIIADALACGAGRLLAVATTERLSVVAAYALVKFAIMRMPDLPIAVLINRCEPKDAARLFGMVAAGAEQYLGHTVVPAGVIPEDAALRDAAEQGLSPTLSSGSAADAAGLLAELLINAATARPGRPPLLRTT